ncbi:family 20 glycosylhydrolase [Sphingobacterium bovistauri]|uniref:beta-N-acetylhexosaminidase n=1 Tax=Sphingobacterium bovistauri TaxID=2781959 RepID=A0ABS7ZAT2_9SPHI|nr:family 20 glycosylhydrolase [Sphingobacterium bovistauri]MCA5006024.1 carbohydate-binding domain-containing protein [Sphingobacterium bovistauri]
MSKYSAMIHKFLFLLIIMFSINPIFAQGTIVEDISIKWKPSVTYNGKDDLSLQIVIKNDGKSNFSLKDWDLFFNTMYPIVEANTEVYKLIDLSGNLFKIEFKPKFITPQDSVVVEYKTQFAIVGISTRPNGFYFLNKLDKTKFEGVGRVEYEDIEPIEISNRLYLEQLYAKNQSFQKEYSPIKIFPTPKSLKEMKGNFDLDKGFLVEAPSDWQQPINKVLEGVAQIQFNAKKNNFIVRLNSNLEAEAYRLSIKPNQIEIQVSEKVGLFYALQSIRSLYDDGASKYQKKVDYLPCIEVEDEPRYSYRGFMLDIARNFRSKSVVMKYLDMMARYKLNVFHLHFIEDEAWRIEIPGLPELTEVGAWRSPAYLDGNSLMPAYGSGINNERKYLTREDFIEILKYAQERNITVIPEIETPGHARASIKAMEARYNKYMSQGNSAAAEEFLLHDFEDISIYNTAQNFGDNVLNPALPSVYRFLDKVLEEFRLMYQEAGVPFKTVSLGGDEVPPGVWEKSPKIKALMREQGLKSVYDVWTYYIDKINQLCLAKGLQMAGWEEIGMVNKGKGMIENPEMPNKQNMLLDVWNNIIGGGNDDLVYRLANAGYPTVLISSSNLYFDMMWDSTYREPGFKWATFADLQHSYSLFPEDYFANIHTYYSGKKLDKSYLDKLTRINDKGRANFKGIKGGLFAETILDDDALDYMVFPRFFVLAERAWSQRRSYESEETYDQTQFDMEYIAFLNRVVKVELPSISARIKYRLPRVGLKVENFVLRANVEYPGFPIYYTVDGTFPSLSSPKFDIRKGVKVKSGDKVKAVTIDNDGRFGLLSQLSID